MSSEQTCLGVTKSGSPCRRKVGRDKSYCYQHDFQQTPTSREEERFSELRQELEARLGKRRRFTFLLIGEAGVGKSSTVNSLLGREAAAVGSFEPVTRSAKAYRGESAGIQFTVVDTPGLFDTKGEELDRLNEIKGLVDEVDCLWFVSRLDYNRVNAIEAGGIALISEVFGRTIWQHSIVVLTHADHIQAAEYADRLQKRAELLRRSIVQFGGSADLADEVPVVAVSNRTHQTPDGVDWLSVLYVKVLSRIARSGALPFMLMTASRVRTDTQEGDSATKVKGDVIILSKEQQQELRTTIQKTFSFGDIAKLATAAGAAGAAAGGLTVGAASFGLFALAGMLCWVFSD